MKILSKNQLFYFLIVIIFSCNSSKKEEINFTSVKNKPIPVSVTTDIAKIKPFFHELWCNGKVEAGSLAIVQFEQQGLIKEVLVKNGQSVLAGNILVRLEDNSQQISLQKAKNRLERAKVEMADILLAYNSKGDTSGIPERVRQTAYIRSGYSDAIVEVNEAQLHLSKTVIKAPISGRIVDLKVKPFNPTTAYDKVCRIIDESSLVVRFGIMESELNWATEGAEVMVSPLSNPEIKTIGKITEVNRIIDNSGMIEVIAKLPETNYFLPGMNVKLCIRKSFPSSLVIPAGALTQRQNRDVVFVMNDTLAEWRYVKVGPRNVNEVVILEGLKPGEKVIVNGNATIGHDAWVKEQ